MNLNVKFEESKKDFPVVFGETYRVSDGGFERGYAKGYENGSTEGYTKGHTDGVKQGYVDGFAEGEESRYPTEDALLAKTIVEYRNNRPVTIGNRFFSYCYNLTKVELPNAVSVGDYAFTYCTALREITLPSVQTIAAFAFQNCTALTVIDLGAANSLQSNVFTGTNINKLILRRTDTITTNNSTAVFNNTPMSRGEGYIYVPDNLVEQYKAATNWSTFASQIKPLSELEGST